MRQINAPAIEPLHLWRMSAEDFNTWRKRYDFPRIVRTINDSIRVIRFAAK